MGWFFVSVAIVFIFIIDRELERRNRKKAVMIKGFLWTRPFMPERYVDGDTIIGLIDRGENDFYRPKKGIRLVCADGRKYDAPEVKVDPSRARAAMEAAFLLCPVGIAVISTSHKVAEDVYGRPLVSIKLSDGRDLASVLIEMGHVK